MVRSGHVLQLTAITLLGLATVIVSSAGMTVGTPNPNQGNLLWFLWDRHRLYAGLAIVAMALASRFNTRCLLKLRGPSSPVFWLVVISLVFAAMTLVPGLGKSVNGASRWLYVGPKSWGISFQPSELVKWVMVLAIATWCTRRRGVMYRFHSGLAPMLGIVITACAMIMIEDLGTAVLLGMVALCLLLAGGARFWQLALLVPPAAVMLVGAIIRSPYRTARLGAFLDPWADPLGSGYHPIQSLLAIAQGGIMGRGLGNGIQKFGYLPEDTTDFIFAVICEELGIFGAALIVGLYLVLLWTGLAIARQCQDTFGRLFALGVVLTIGLQATLNMAVVTVMIPTKGIALPLVSAGGTGWVLTASALGLVAALDTSHQCHAQPPPYSVDRRRMTR